QLPAAGVRQRARRAPGHPGRPLPPRPRLTGVALITPLSEIGCPVFVRTSACQAYRGGIAVMGIVSNARDCLARERIMNLRARGTAALLAATGLVAGLVTGAPSAAAASSPGTISTVAGGPGRGPATRVYQLPNALAVGPGGVLYVGDIGVNVVREFSNTDTFE